MVCKIFHLKKTNSVRQNNPKMQVLFAWVQAMPCIAINRIALLLPHSELVALLTFAIPDHMESLHDAL